MIRHKSYRDVRELTADEMDDVEFFCCMLIEDVDLILKFGLYLAMPVVAVT